MGTNQIKKTFSSWGIVQALDCHSNGNGEIRNNELYSKSWLKIPPRGSIYLKEWLKQNNLLEEIYLRIFNGGCEQEPVIFGACKN